MTNASIGLLVVFVYVGAVVLSLPAAAAVLLLARRLGTERAASLVSFGTLAIVALVAIGVGVVVGASAGVAIAGYGVAATLLLWTLPVAVGRWLVGRATGMAADLALVVSAVWFVAPGGPARYNLTFLTGPALWAATAVLLAIVFLGPGLVGVGLVRLVGRRRRVSSGRS